MQIKNKMILVSSSMFSCDSVPIVNVHLVINVSFAFLASLLSLSVFHKVVGPFKCPKYPYGRLLSINFSPRVIKDSLKM